MSRLDVPSLVAGVAVIAFGVVLLLDAEGTLELTFAVLGPLICAAAGAILLASGLSRRG